MQKTLFDIEEEAQKPKVQRPKGGSQNPIVFHDYESFIAKFTDRPKTTDECWTPKDIYDAVVKYVGTVVDLTGKEILRPFYPGGDYENAEYPEDGIVIDNPPFSMFTKICAFYTRAGIPFFLFGPGMTIGSVFKYCTAVIISEQITFGNGAKIRCNFASNLYGDTLITTAPLLDRLIMSCESQDTKANLQAYEYPEELLSVSDMQTICKGGIDFSVSRSEGAIIKKLTHHPKKSGLFGEHILISTAKAAAKAAAKVPLSESEKEIVQQLK